MSDLFLAHSEISNEIYIICGKKKYPVTEQVVSAMKATGRLNERPQGKWKKIGEEYYNWHNHTVIKCLRCGYVKNIPGEITPHFCEECGSDMRGT